MFLMQNLRTFKKPPLPPGPRGLPMIGNLHQLDNSIICLQLWQLSKKYGPIFSLQLGLSQASYLLAKIGQRGNTTDFLGQDFELIPFGAGRRICPGLPMAVVTLELVLANLIHSFDWELPQGMKKEDIDHEVLPGITQHKKNQLCLCAKAKS
ncbi:hypothetical protein Fmac_012000 [Flemingia macrophylla]|uniref:Cytochrome P450 n=1 Tax=Flemingia macrophylla TaxID=520843 RepID=A0ABD1MP21_9FABA